jgi:hypothetical protein
LREIAIEAHLEDSPGAGHQRDGLELRLESRQQFLRQPRRPQQPAALRAVFDFNFPGHARFLPLSTQRCHDFLIFISPSRKAAKILDREMSA